MILPGKTVVAVVAPTQALARTSAALLAVRMRGVPHRPFSLAAYLGRASAPSRVVLCPAGRSLAGDVAFLREVRDRALWGMPDPIVYSAIAGLLGYLPEDPPPRGPRVRAGRGPALLMEGTVGWKRAKAALSGSSRLWIVERAGSVTLPAGRLERLRAGGVRWAVLEPVTVVAVAGNRRLARARPRWKHLLPARTPVWVIP